MKPTVRCGCCKVELGKHDDEYCLRALERIFASDPLVSELIDRDYRRTDKPNP